MVKWLSRRLDLTNSKARFLLGLLELRSIDMLDKTEREKFTKWFNEQKENGMVDLKYLNILMVMCTTVAQKNTLLN